MLHKLFFTCIIVYFTFTGLVRADDASDILVDNLKLYVGGKEFFIKAMCYNPVPLGIQHMTEDGNEGGGFCSPRLTPYGDWKSACYDSDYFDGGANPPGSIPPGPSSWFAAVWERDFPHLKNLGVNTIRIYNTNPTTYQASLNPANNIPSPTGKNHIPFMDKAHQDGFKVIFPLFGDYTEITTKDAATIQMYIRWQIDEVGNHPALLMFTYGNELDLSADPALVQLVNTNIAYARNYMKIKWNRRVPITTAIVDLPDSYDKLYADLDVDVFTTNAGYRGFDFSDLWSGNSRTQGLYKLSCQTGKPAFIGEIGWLSLNGEVNALYPDWVNRVWKDLVHHIDQGCIGGAFFEYNDEPLSKADPLQQHMGVVSFSISDNSDKPNVFVVDKVTKRDFIYDALASGTYEGKPYNMNADPWELIGRSAHTLFNSPSICEGNSSSVSSGLPASTSGAYIPQTTGGTGGNTPSPTSSGSGSPTPTPSSSSTGGSDSGSSPSPPPISSGGLEDDFGSTTGSQDSGASVMRPLLTTLPMLVGFLILWN